ncbi:RHS repeat-associated core domain-containing protein, partial [Actinokineospora iranica]
MLDTNPRGYWRLSEASGNTAVSEVPGFWGTADGTAASLTRGAVGPLGSSATTASGFGANLNHVRLPDNLVRDSAHLAVEMWFKTTATNGGVLFSTANNLPTDANPTGAMPDALGNLIRQAGAGAAATPDRVFGYDPLGRMTSAAAGTTNETFVYDDRGNLVSATGSAGNTANTWNADNLLAATTTAAGTTTFTYDPVGRPATAADPLTGATAAYTYDEAGRLTTVGHGTGKATRTYTYDSLNRLTTDTTKAPNGTATSSISYGYDAEDRLTSKTITGLAGAGANTYGYDQAGRLTSWNDGTTTTAYAWDDNGNLVQSGPTSATYDQRNRLTSRGGSTYAYTPRGTLAATTTGGTTTTSTFNAFDELTSEGPVTHTYDALNRLVATGSRTLTYAGASSAVVTDGSATYTRTPTGTPLGIRQGTATGLAWTNLHTDLVAVTDPVTGAALGSRGYDPFGNRTAAAGVQPDLGFQSQYTDPTSGAVNMGARWYAPGTANFLSRDTTPLDPRDLLNANRHTYAASSPLNHTDPTGRFVWFVIPAVPAIVTAAANGVAWLTVAAGGAAVTEKVLEEVKKPKSNPNPTPSTISPPPRPDRSWDWYRQAINQLYQLLAQLPATGNGPSHPNPNPDPGTAASPDTPGGGDSGRNPGKRKVRSGLPLKQMAEAVRAVQDQRGAEVLLRALTPRTPPPITQTIAAGAQAMLDELNNQPTINLGALTANTDQGEQPQAPGETPQESAG